MMRATGIYLGFSACFFAGYQLLILALFLLRAGAWPNYFRVHNFVLEVIETLSYWPSWREVTTLIPDQPVYLYAWVFEKTHTTEWLFIFTLRNLAISATLSALLAANLVLFRRLKAHRGSAKSSACVGGMAGVVGTGVSAAACCGSASSFSLLSALGLGSSVIMFIDKFSTPLEWLGIALLIASAMHLYRKTPRAAR